MFPYIWVVDYSGGKNTFSMLRSFHHPSAPSVCELNFEWEGQGAKGKRGENRDYKDPVSLSPWWEPHWRMLLYCLWHPARDTFGNLLLSPPLKKQRPQHGFACATPVWFHKTPSRTLFHGRGLYLWGCFPLCPAFLIPIQYWNPLRIHPEALLSFIQDMVMILTIAKESGKL